MKLGNMDKALLHLRKYYDLAQEDQDSQMQADAAFNLAQLYQKQNNKEEALKNYQAYFENAKKGTNQTKNMD